MYPARVPSSRPRRVSSKSFTVGTVPKRVPPSRGPWGWWARRTRDLASWWAWRTRDLASWWARRTRDLASWWARRTRTAFAVVAGRSTAETHLILDPPRSRPPRFAFTLPPAPRGRAPANPSRFRCARTFLSGGDQWRSTCNQMSIRCQSYAISAVRSDL